MFVFWALLSWVWIVRGGWNSQADEKLNFLILWGHFGGNVCHSWFHSFLCFNQLSLFSKATFMFAKHCVYNAPQILFCFFVNSHPGLVVGIKCVFNPFLIKKDLTINLLGFVNVIGKLVNNSLRKGSLWEFCFYYKKSGRNLSQRGLVCLQNIKADVAFTGCECIIWDVGCIGKDGKLYSPFKPRSESWQNPMI